MKGLSMADIRKHPSLIPLFACVAVGGAGAAYYLFRLATRNPDVSWVPSKTTEPWHYYKDKQYKFYATEEMKAQAPPKIPEY